MANNSPKSAPHQKTPLEKTHSEDNTKPEPRDVEAFLPWICGQMELDFNVVINKNMIQDYVGAASHRSAVRGKMKAASGSQTSTNAIKDDETVDEGYDAQRYLNKLIHVTVVYDNHENLIGFKFEKNRTIPRQIIKIIGLILKYHTSFSSFTITRGLNAYVLYEVNKLLQISKITDICFDNCFIKERTYYTLLEKSSCLRNLSLSRCRIDDVGVKLIAEQLAYPMPGSTMLLVLNLSTNSISDVGARSLGSALRTNGKLVYLNLADNMISDKGAEYILNSLMEFSLTDEELLSTRRRHSIYLKEKNEIVTRLLIELKANDLDRAKQQSKKKPQRPTTAGLSKKSKVIEKELSNKNLGDAQQVTVDPFLYEKASYMAEINLGPFKDPYCEANIVSKDGQVFCLGNKTMCYLNLAYNDMSFCSVQKLLNVLVYQKSIDRKPRGLVNVCLEGNQLPVQCNELVEINAILDSGLSLLIRRSGMSQSQKKHTNLKVGKIPR